ncbi:MAG: hypothetical protein DRP89_06275 [Candidatus Neomarinimicrobiota bacterium]|nr:MAG: hypothetical protein DRP89_06275 [Candidatus Neomarinimicrobiota bacterium]
MRKAWLIWGQVFYFRFFGMYTTYVLYSEKYDKIYIGFTSNLEGRLLAHNELSTKGWTVRFRPWRLFSG